MSEISKEFLKKAEEKAFDLKHRKTIKFNIGRYNLSVPKGKLQYSNLELAKRRAAAVKCRVVNELENYLKEFEANFTARGGKIIWAVDAHEAIHEISKVLKNASVKKVVKSKSMTTEEIEFNEELHKEGITSIETDLGEYIVQVAGEKPYHIITPVMHKSKEDIAALFNQKFNTPAGSSPEYITAWVREKLRKEFVTADAGISGANFLIADTGSVCLTENEGNALMSTSFPRIHIAIGGLEKILPSMKDLALFWPLLSTHGTGQNVTVYNSIISGPRQEGESDGPEEMYVVLLDNGRTELLKQKDQKIALSCIRCGACLNGCPIYRNIGGHSYGTVYSGPIGAVITPHLKGFGNYKHLSFASSLCGKCSDVCPMKIPLHKLLLYNRRDSVKLGHTTSSEKLVIYGWKTVMTHRWMIDKFGSGTKNRMIGMFFRGPWGKRREIPVIKQKSFNKLWKESKGM